MSDTPYNAPTVGRCDMCGDLRALHLAGAYLICDACETSLRGEEE